MHPVYMWGGPNPYHANPTQHYAANADPRAKEISSHMKMDPNPTSITSPYQPWPYAGNYYYPGPQECHGGYNHGCFGGPYGFQPPYPYYPPPSPYHTHGLHPTFPGAFPAYSYSIPPPHYSVEQPRYDYDKNAHGSRHCCGCNHREDEKKSMVKQEESEIEKKTSDSLIPFLMKDYPYPIMWVPPGFMNTESNEKEKDKHTRHDRDPLDSLELSKQGGNGETERNQTGGGDDNRLPFPIFRFPSKNNDSGEKNDDKKRQTKINDEAETDTGIKPLIQKVIPVKQLGAEEEKKPLKSIETKAKSASVEKTDGCNEGKASPKTPKLPPVCLRVDPLPRKKNSTSRSPSPPGDKIRSKGSTVNESRSSQQQQTQLPDGLKKSNEEKGENAIKTIKVVESDCENVSKGSGKKLSENEAALIIQSAYRGFQVRKSKPITKLRQIAEVEKRVVELRNRVRDLESSCFDNKEKLVIGETIMSLLLKLDTIQGLHPVVREVRKCVAKELVGLQEKLDSLKPQPPIEQDATKMKPPNTNLEPETELQNEENTEEVNNNRLLDDDVIQDKLGGKGDDIHEKSETQSDSNVESAMINSEDGTYVDERSSGELNKDKKLPDDVIKDKLPQADGNGESGGKDDDEMEQTVAEENSKGQMSVDAIQAESGTNVRPQSTDEVTKNKVESDTAAESGTYVDPQSTEEVTKDEMESDTAAESGIYVEPHTTEEVTKKEMESDTAAESATYVEPQCQEEVNTNQFESDTAAESATYVEPQSIEEVTKNQAETDTAAECEEFNAEKPQSTAEVTKNQVEMLSDEENVEEGDVQSDEKNPKEDSVKAMEEVVKEQMDVIRELTAKVKDLEKKLSKNKNNKKMKKAYKGRKSRGCVVEEE